jgi:putative transposase
LLFRRQQVNHLAHNAPLPPKKFLLKFACDRQCCLRWVLEAKKRFGLSVLDYMVTCNHVPSSDQRHRPKRYRPQYAADCRPHRTRIQPTQKTAGAFWEDRFHATAIESDEHLHRCLVYIDWNMVRAGVIDHPVKWVNSGYDESQQPPKRYRVIDLAGLLGYAVFRKLADFQQAHRQWVEIALRGELSARDRTVVRSRCGWQSEFC